MTATLAERLVQLMHDEPTRVCRALNVAAVEQNPHLPTAPPELQPLFASGYGTVLAIAVLAPEREDSPTLWVEWASSENVVEGSVVPLNVGLARQVSQSRHRKDAAWLVATLSLQDGAVAATSGMTVRTLDGLGAAVAAGEFSREATRGVRSGGAVARAHSLLADGQRGSALVVLRQALARADEEGAGVIHAALVPVLHALGRPQHARRSEAWAEEPVPSRPLNLRQAIRDGDLHAFQRLLPTRHGRSDYGHRLPYYLQDAVGLPAPVALVMLAALTSDGSLLEPHHAKTFAVCASKEAVMCLVRGGLDPNYTDSDGQTALFSAGTPERIVWLVQAGADPNAIDPRFRTPLFTQAHAKDPQACVAALIEAGADPTAVDSEGDHYWHDAPILRHEPAKPQAAKRVVRRKRK